MSSKCNMDNWVGLKIGPNLYDESIRPEYELLKRLGSGCFGQVYLARKLNPKQKEDEFYAIKLFIDRVLPGRSILNSEGYKNWKKEVNCLLKTKDICKDVDIICYKESFIGRFDKEVIFFIVYPLLENYINFEHFFDPFKYDKYNLTLDESKEIYKKLVNVVNSLTKFCISHNDFNLTNIMIHPNTKDVKVIDLGLCEEESYKSYEYDQRSLDRILILLISKLTHNMKTDKQFDKQLEKQFNDYAPREKWNPNCIVPMMEPDFFIANNVIEFQMMALLFETIIKKSNNLLSKSESLQKYIDFLLLNSDYIGPIQIFNANIFISEMTGKGDNQFEKYRKQIYREFDDKTTYPKNYDIYVLEPLRLFEQSEKNKSISPKKTSPKKSPKR